MGMEETVGQHLMDKQNKIFLYQDDQLGGIPVKLNKYGDIMVSKKMDKVNLHENILFAFFKHCIFSGSARLAQIKSMRVCSRRGGAVLK